MRISTSLLIFSLFTWVSSVQGQEAVKDTQAHFSAFAVALNVNLMPFFPKTYESPTIPYELPIGRFQPSFRIYRKSTHKWLEINLLALNPGIKNTVLDTATTSTFGSFPPTLRGVAGTYRNTHFAIGITEGKVRKKKIFGCPTMNEVGVLASFRQTEFKNRADIFPTVRDWYSEVYMIGISYAFTLRAINKPRYHLDFKIYNYIGYGAQLWTGPLGEPFYNFNFDGAILIPQAQLVVPFGEK